MLRKLTPELLDALRKIAGQESRQLQVLIDEALREYIGQKQGKVPRKRVMQSLHESINEFSPLYRELAK